MDNRGMISASEFCLVHEIELSFIHSLGEYGLLEVIVVQEQPHFPEESLNQVEMFIRLHFELGINIEGLDAVRHLLDRNRKLQSEMSELTNKLKKSG